MSGPKATPTPDPGAHTPATKSDDETKPTMAGDDGLDTSTTVKTACPLTMNA